MPPAQLTLARMLVAWAVVVLVVVAVWKFVDYRNQPPPMPSVAAPL
jgi:hypothetical protein